MRSVPAIDATAMNSLTELYHICKEKNIQLIFSHVNAQPLSAMKKSGLYDKIGKENFCPHIDNAIKRAERISN